jgi:hypothetical protein
VTRSEERIIQALAQRDRAAPTTWPLPPASPVTPLLRATRRLWLRLALNREPIRTGLRGRPRLRYMLGLGAHRGRL